MPKAHTPAPKMLYDQIMEQCGCGHYPQKDNEAPPPLAYAEVFTQPTDQMWCPVGRIPSASILVYRVPI
jgi:hypothetical protein